MSRDRFNSLSELDDHEWKFVSEEVQPRSFFTKPDEIVGKRVISTIWKCTRCGTTGMGTYPEGLDKGGPQLRTWVSNFGTECHDNQMKIVRYVMED